MSETLALPELVDEARPQRAGRSRLRSLLLYLLRKPITAFSVIFITLLFITSIGAPWIAPYGYSERAGTALTGPSSSNLMGTDKWGRDQFSRIVYGSRSTVRVGLGVAALATAIALALGLVAGIFGGWVDFMVQRLVDILMSLPWFVVALAVLAFSGTGEMTLIALLGVLLAPGMSRVIRSAALPVSTSMYVEAARAVGASTPRIIFLHALPNVIPTVIVVGTLAVGNAVLAEAALSFLGFGIAPPTPSWGEMLSTSGRQSMQAAPWLAIFPGLAVALTVFSFNMLGDTLRDFLDPRLRGT